MVLRVKLFAAAREAAGGAEVAVEVGDAARASDVLAALAGRGPDLARIVRRSRLARNLVFAAPDAPIAPGDELALIPPVGGG